MSVLVCHGQADQLGHIWTAVLQSSTSDAQAYCRPEVEEHTASCAACSCCSALAHTSGVLLQRLLAAESSTSRCNVNLLCLLATADWSCFCAVLFLQQKSLEAAATKDAKDVATLATNSFNSLNKKLLEKFKHIEALNAKYQQVSHTIAVTCKQVTLVCGVQLMHRSHATYGNTCCQPSQHALVCCNTFSTHQQLKQAYLIRSRPAVCMAADEVQCRGCCTQRRMCISKQAVFAEMECNVH